MNSCAEICDEKSQYTKYGKKEKLMNTEKKKQEKAVHNPMIQQVVINLQPKYDHSSLLAFGYIFDEIIHYSKYGRKRKLGRYK